MSTAREPDPYEQEYMKGQGEVVYRDKMRAPRIFHALFLLPILATFAGALAILLGVGAHPAPLPVALLPLSTMLVLTFAWLAFSVLRVTVSSEELVVQYGLFGPRIPIAAIEQCEVVNYNAMDYGGWGIRVGADGTTVYNMIGDGSRAVRVVYRLGATTQTVLLSSSDPEALGAAIKEARAKHTTRVRAEASANTPALAEVQELHEAAQKERDENRSKA